MPCFRVIVEQADRNDWSAWFAVCPQLSSHGEFPRNAIDTVLKSIFGFTIDNGNLRVINELTRSGHIEFDIRLLNQHVEIIQTAQRLTQIPKHSEN